ncbi:MAG: hypothetical protein AAF125_13790 [Chloroflexota bacterium]
MTYDLICMGRASIDLFSDDIGAPFEEINGFRVFVGGTPPQHRGRRTTPGLADGYAHRDQR